MWKREIKRGERDEKDLNPEQKAKLDQYLHLKKKLGLTWSEMSAVHGYTDDQYHLLNPALSAGAFGKGWLDSKLKFKDKVRGQTIKSRTPEEIDRALEANLMIAGYAIAGMRKLPEWKHDRMIYRGETVP